jgi:hypothetical protein
VAHNVIRTFLAFFVFTGLAGWPLATQTSAAPPSETLLPPTTKGFVSVPDPDGLRAKWDTTQLGKLTNDPVMKPFVEDLRRQLKSKLDQTDTRVGISVEELEGVYGGEICVALIQPWDAEAADSAVREAAERAAEKGRAAGQNEEQIAAVRKKAEQIASQEQNRQRQAQHALAMLVDVTDHKEAALALLDKVAKRLISEGATKDSAKIAGVQMSVLTIPIDDEGNTRTAYYCIQDDLLVATDHQEVAAEILRQMAEPSDVSLATAPAFEAVISRSHQAMGDVESQIRWFVEPFGLVEVVRAVAGGRKKRGTDVLKVLGNQGFKAIQGLGGCVALSTTQHQILQRTYIYAPAVPRAEGDANSSKYDLAARMLEFPNSLNLTPQPFVPRELASFLTFNWKMQDAFWYAESLVNEFAGDDVFQDVLKSIETDPNGPQINVGRELIDHLGERATLFADCRVPITPKSERILVAIDVTDAEKVRTTVDKAMESDPEARRLDHDGHIIWELVNEEPIEVETVQIDGPGFGFGFDEPEEEPIEEEKPFRPNAAVTVVKSHLIVSSHVDYIVDLLERPEDAETLDSDGAYQMIAVALDELGAGEDSFRFFTRTDEAYRTTYELLRQGKMPEAESLLGKLLNRLLEPEEEGVMREQVIDGSQLPEFQVVRRYLGPAGLYVRSEDDGWAITGCLLDKQAP